MQIDTLESSWAQEYSALLSSICLDPHVQQWLNRMRNHEKNLYRHSLRVGRLAADFYSFTGMAYSRGWSLIEGALLHDLGKISVDATVLTRPHVLNGEEKRMVAMHPVVGAEILQAQAYFSKPVINIVRRHHERLDGSGYPNGWRKKRTAKIVRIVAACDALCAMTEDRPYEDAWPVSEALLRLKSMPEQYDVEIVRDLETMIHLRGTTIPLYESVSAATKDFTKRASGVKRPRSAFYPPRTLSRLHAKAKLK